MLLHSLLSASGLLQSLSNYQRTVRWKPSMQPKRRENIPTYFLLQIWMVNQLLGLTTLSTGYQMCNSHDRRTKGGDLRLRMMVAVSYQCSLYRGSCFQEP